MTNSNDSTGISPRNVIDTQDKMAYGCIFCRTGKEKSIADRLSTRYPLLKAIVPQKMLFIRLHGKLEERTSILFPGYIFVRAPITYPLCQISRDEGIIRVLTMTDGIWQLGKEDEALIGRLFELDGFIGLSKVFYEGDRIRAVDGLLRDYDGCIVRVDRRKSKAQVRFRIGLRDVYTWIGFEEIDKQERIDNTEV